MDLTSVYLYTIIIVVVGCIGLSAILFSQKKIILGAAVAGSGCFVVGVGMELLFWMQIAQDRSQQLLDTASNGSITGNFLSTNSGDFAHQISQWQLNAPLIAAGLFACFIAAAKLSGHDQVGHSSRLGSSKRVG
ncbi:MAG: hypothetical protein ABI716_01555 [Candidatus Saccharibacteria bacterium]